MSDGSVESVSSSLEKWNRSEPIELAEDRFAWQQQPGEKDQHFKGFQEYLSAPRRVSASGQVVGRKFVDVVGEIAGVSWSYRHVLRVAKRFRWVERAELWDEDRESRVGGEVADARVLAAKARARDVSELRGLAVELVKEIPAEDWKVRDRLELLRIAWGAEDSLFGFPQVVGGSAVSVSVGVGEGVDESRVEAVLEELRRRELLARGVLEGGVVDE